MALDYRCCKYPRCGGNPTRMGYCDKHYQKYKDVDVYFEKSRHNEGSPDPFTWHAVYIIGTLGFSPVKIGRTSDLWSRVLQMQTGCPFDMRVFGAFFGKPAAIVSLEWEAQWTLTELGCHMSGEWFEVHPSDAAAVVHKCASQRGINVLPFDEFRPVIKETGWSAHMNTGWDSRLERAWHSYDGSKQLLTEDEIAVTS